MGDRGTRGEEEKGIGVMLLTWIGRPRERLGDFIYIILLNSPQYRFLFFITITFSNILFYFKYLLKLELGKIKI